MQTLQPDGVQSDDHLLRPRQSGVGMPATTGEQRGVGGRRGEGRRRGTVEGKHCVIEQAVVEGELLASLVLFRG